jgi:hypothetical protein
MKFNEGIKGSLQEPGPCFVVDTENKVAQVHPSVLGCMDHISKDVECAGTTAMSDLLQIVKTKLLVVRLPQSRPSALHLDEVGGQVAVTHAKGTHSYPPTGPSRCSAKVFRNLLDGMIGKGEVNERYWFTGTARDGLRGPRPRRPVPSIVTRPAQDNFLSPESARQKPPVDRKREPYPAGTPAQLAPSPRQNVSTPLGSPDSRVRNS